MLQINGNNRSTGKKGRPRKYGSDAERQAAYRARNYHLRPAPQSDIRKWAERLAYELDAAAMEGHAIGQRVTGGNDAQVLEQLTYYIQDLRGVNNS
jgi:hypothetical protein